MTLPAELHLTEAESRQMAEAQLNFQAEFNVVVPPKVQAGLALLGVSFGIYRGKLGKLGARVREQRRQAAEAANPGNIKGPVNQPWRQPAPVAPVPTGMQPGEEAVLRAGVVSRGDETAILTGASVDGGKLQFGPPGPIKLN